MYDVSIYNRSLFVHSRLAKLHSFEMLLTPPNVRKNRKKELKKRVEEEEEEENKTKTKIIDQ